MLRHLAPAFISLACLGPITSAQTTEDLKLVASDGTAGDRFGRAVALNGNTAVIGAFYDDDQNFSGSAYVFDVTTGQQLFKLDASDPGSYDYFGRFVAVSGSTALISSEHDDDGGIGSGSAYVFDTTTGQEIFKLRATDARPHDRFGHSVALSGNMAVVGAPESEPNGIRSGSAYVFDVTTGKQVFKLTPDDGAAWQEFGHSVAISIWINAICDAIPVDIRIMPIPYSIAINVSI